MVLCDTNIFVHAFNGNPDTISELQKIGFDNIVISAVTVMELYQGMGNKNELAQMKSRIRYYDVIEIDSVISKLAVRFVEQFNLSHGLVIPDAMAYVEKGREEWEERTQNFDFAREEKVPEELTDAHKAILDER